LNHAFSVNRQYPAAHAANDQFINLLQAGQLHSLPLSDHAEIF